MTLKIQRDNLFVHFLLNINSRISLKSHKKRFIVKTDNLKRVFVI